MPKPSGSVTTNAGPQPVLTPPRSAVLYGDGAGNSAILGAEILFAGGAETSGYARPSVGSLRDGIQTTNATPNQVLTSTATKSGEQIRVITEVFAKRTDADGDSAWFLLRAVYLNVLGTLNVVKAPEVLATGTSGSAASWTAAISATGANVQTLVKGEAGKTIHWAVIREQVEVL